MLATTSTARLARTRERAAVATIRLCIDENILQEEAVATAVLFGWAGDC
jgi:hypothetical protein